MDSVPHNPSFSRDHLYGKHIQDQYQREAQYRIYQGQEKPVKVFTCTVGAQPSFAAYCLYALEDVVSLRDRKGDHGSML